MPSPSVQSCSSPSCTDQLHQDYDQHHNHHLSPRPNAGSSRPSQPQRTLLEPPRAPFPATDRPSSPRHYSTSISWERRLDPFALPTAAQASRPRDSAFNGFGDGDDADILPVLPVTDDPEALTAFLGWSSDALDRLDDLPPSDDSFFASLANTDFPPSPAGILPLPTLSNTLSDSQITDNSFSTSSQRLTHPRFTSNSGSNLTEPTAPSTSTSFNDSFNSAISNTVDPFITAPSSFSTSFDMPANTRRRGSTTTEETIRHVDKRRRTSVSRPNLSNLTRHSPGTGTKLEDDPFAEPGINGDIQTVNDDDAPYMIDLTEPNEVVEDVKLSPEPPKEEDKRTKLSAFQCVICMDDVTTLTLTHCGHLFCAQCLHSSLHVEATRGKCPMCRQRIDMKPRDSYSTKTKGFWPLELKLMTSTRKGKRKAGAIS